MKYRLLLGAGCVALGLGAALYLFPIGPNRPAAEGPGAATAEQPLVEVILPAKLSPDAQLGKRAYDAVCAACHGANAAGREGKGPPFVHPIYKPDHHGDQAFQIAVKQGAQAHHWRFGNMPPQPGLTMGEVKHIIAYVREVQRANGIE